MKNEKKPVNPYRGDPHSDELGENIYSFSQDAGKAAKKSMKKKGRERRP